MEPNKLVENFEVRNGSLVEKETNKVVLAANDFKAKMISFISNLGIDVNSAVLTNDEILFENEKQHKAVYKKANSEIRDAVIDNSSLSVLSAEDKLAFIDVSGKALLSISNAMLIPAVQDIRLQLSKAVK